MGGEELLPPRVSFEEGRARIITSGRGKPDGRTNPWNDSRTWMFFLRLCILLE